MKKTVIELIGTFFLVSTVGNTVINPGGAGNLAPIAIGTILMVMVFAGGHISGGHYNPAVTLAVLLRGKCPLRDAITYWIAQIFSRIRCSGGCLIFERLSADPSARGVSFRSRLDC